MPLCRSPTPNRLLHIQRMMLSKGVLFSCLLILVALDCSESDIKELCSKDDLKSVFSENSLPLHGLTLLHWFANNVDIDNNNVVYLSFNPNGDFGSHFYGNYENVLPPVSRGYDYFTVGNVNPHNQDTCSITQELPEYVLRSPVIEYASTGRNSDRIIYSVEARNNGACTISQVFLTQHFRFEDNQGSGYDPAHTFGISTNLLQEIRHFSFNNNRLSLHELRNQFDWDIDDGQLNEIINTWGSYRAPLGLLHAIIIRQNTNWIGLCNGNRRFTRALPVKAVSWQNCESQRIHVDVQTGGNGKAKIVWRNVPVNEHVALVLFKNQMDKDSITCVVIQDSVGSYETSVSLSEGLQVRLHKVKGYFLQYFLTLKEEICRGKEFQSPHAVSINGYAQLQLFVRNGKGCFRLYIKENCDGWKSAFSNAWVALYASAEKDTDDYLSSQWNWVSKFKQGLNSGEYNTFEYCTSTTVVPGLQARFVDGQEKARTPIWH